MRPIIIRFFLPVFCLLFLTNAYAQTCTGSLGDPVINETFGSGKEFIGPMLPYTTTDLDYYYNELYPCPSDGTYTIMKSTSGCFSGTWHSVYTDHTGDPNGYMMLINASDQPSTFYVQKADGGKLCPNTTYEFAAWIINLLKDEPQTNGFVAPNITFSIEKKDGTVIKNYNTGLIPATTQPEWKQYGTFFVSPADGSDVLVRLINNTVGSNGNDFALDDITFKPCGPIIQTGFGTIGNITAQNQCVDNNSSYTLVASQQGYSDPRYQWQVNTNGAGWVDVPGATTTKLVQTFTNPAAALYQYRIGVLNGNITSLNCRIYSQPLNVNIYPYPVINLPADTSLCQGSELEFQGPRADSYEWSGPNGFTSTEQNAIASYALTQADNGIYSLKVTTNGCPSFASVNVKVFSQITAVVSSNVAICTGASTPLSVQSPGATSYKWTPSAGLDHDNTATVTASPAQTTTYSVIVNNGGCYVAGQPVTVTVLQNPGANAGANKVITEGNSVKLNGTATGDSVHYQWTPADHLDNPNSLTPIASPIDNTTYTLHVISNYDCGESTSSVYVRVFKAIKIPNTFTPNNDGKNDLWDIYQLDTYPDCTVKIFDRYGLQVFQSTGYPKPWDGIYNGARLPAGTYYYIIDRKNDFPKLSGWVLMVR